MLIKSAHLLIIIREERGLNAVLAINTADKGVSRKHIRHGAQYKQYRPLEVISRKVGKSQPPG